MASLIDKPPIYPKAKPIERVGGVSCLIVQLSVEKDYGDVFVLEESSEIPNPHAKETIKIWVSGDLLIR